MKKNKLYIALAALILILGVTVFVLLSQRDSEEKNNDAAVSSELTKGSDTTGEVEDKSEEVVQIDDITFSLKAGFYLHDTTLELNNTTGKEGFLYYSLDGSTPSPDANEYGEGILLTSGKTTPNVYCVKAIIEFSDGTLSDVYTKTYFVGSEVFKRYTTLIVSLSGDPAVITDEPNGILYGDNVWLTGKESEREIHVEMFTVSGNPIIDQNCGMRPFGGSSRTAAVNSIKLYSRKNYGKKSFKYDFFKTAKENGSDKNIKSYNRLVLRNLGNDFLLGYIRDEFAQHLAREAGYRDTEGVIPATVYMNGQYYGLLWLHENYSDKYFKEKYGDKAPGEFVVIEGGESIKTSDGAEAAEFNEIHDKLITLDLTNDNNYKLVTDFMDVENYLDYYAFNMIVANNDWPNGNMKCYRYYAAEGEEYGVDVFDGRWRYLLHDMDMSMAIYNSETDISNADFFERILSPESDGYVPLLAHLLERKELKDHFVAKIHELDTGVFAPENVLPDFENFNKSRETEQAYFLEYLNERRTAGDDRIWAGVPTYEDSKDRLRVFLAERADYMEYALGVYFP